MSVWKRKDHYNFFKNFEQPFTGVTTEINCTKAYNYCKAHGVPFFLFYLYKAHLSVNHIKEFRLRIEENEVFEYDQVAGAVTVLRGDETFGFAYFDYKRDFKEFKAETGKAIDLEKKSQGLTPLPGLNGIIHYSVLPMIRINGMQHAQQLSTQDSVPKIVFGKFDMRNSQVFLPISVHVNHAVCDGLHISQFIAHFQWQMELNY